MNPEKANLDGGKGNYSKIDLDNVDSYMPANVQYFLSKMTAAGCRRELPENSDANEPATVQDALRAEWENMPTVSKQYQEMKRLGLLEIGGLDSLGGGEVSSGPFLEGQPIRRRDEDSERGGESVPHYY